MPKKNSNKPSAEQIRQYLLDHPEFFIEHEDVLTALRLPHPGGKVVSLVERQLSALRERNEGLSRRLQEFVANAEANDRLFEKTQRMTREIFAAADLQDLICRVNDALARDFAVDVSSLMLIGAQQQPQDASAARVVSLGEARQAINGILNSSRAVCGSLRPGELSFLFEEQAGRVEAAAVAPLVNGDIVGVLALGSYDPHHFQADMGTIFLSHVGDMLGAVLPRHLTA